MTTMSLVTVVVEGRRRRPTVIFQPAAADTPRRHQPPPERRLTAPVGVFMMAMSIETGKLLSSMFFFIYLNLCIFLLVGVLLVYSFFFVFLRVLPWNLLLLLRLIILVR